MASVQCRKSIGLDRGGNSGSIERRHHPVLSLLPAPPCRTQYRHVKYEHAEPFCPIQSNSVDSRINLRLIGHRKEDVEQTQIRSDRHMRHLHNVDRKLSTPSYSNRRDTCLDNTQMYGVFQTAVPRF